MPPKRSQHNTQDNLTVVRLDQLALLDHLQMRVQTDPALVEQYRRIFVEVGEEQCQCPAITVYLEGVGDRQRYVVSDGHHRVAAARKAGRTTLRAYLREGSLDDARLYAVQHNLRHGQPYTQADKGKIIAWFLDHPRYGRLSNRQLSDLTNGFIPHSTVANHRNRRKLAAVEEVSKLDTGAETHRVAPSFAVKVQRLSRETSRLRDRVANVLLATQDLPEAGAELLPCVEALRAALARFEGVVERLEDESAGEDT